MKGVMRFGKKGKLAPRYIGPYQIEAKVGEVAYRLTLPSELSRIHPVFHVSMLRKYISDPSHVIQTDDVEIGEDLKYDEYPVAIIDQQVKQLRSKHIPMVKVIWKNHSVEDCTWELEQDMRDQFPHLFPQ